MHMEKQNGFVDANRDLNYISTGAVTTGSSELCKGGDELPPCLRGEKQQKNKWKSQIIFYAGRGLIEVLAVYSATNVVL